MRPIGLMIAVLCLSASAAAAAELPVKATVDANTGAVALDGLKIPYSGYASPESLTRFREMQAEHATPPGDSIEDKRAYYDRINSDRAARMKKLYPVKTSEQTIGGVLADVVEPAQGIAAKNTKRVLINLHGGAFLWGARSGALVEAIPVAALGAIKVVAVDYRQGPEHVFPAASDDVEAVYDALLKNYKAQDIGIYGCSAGAFLTGQVVARLIADKRPLPGAVGMFCGGVAEPKGDSTYISALLNGEPIPSAPVNLTDLPYLNNTKSTDPMVLAGNSPAMLAKFPPTLLITGTRDFAMSSVLRSNELLRQQGVDTELRVWDGMWHSFFSDPELPESEQAYEAMVRFFDRHLGASPAKH